MWLTRPSSCNQKGLGFTLESNTSGRQSSLLERHVSGRVIAGEFCTVHVLLEPKNLSISWNSGVSTFQRLATLWFQTIIWNNEMCLVQLNLIVQLKHNHHSNNWVLVKSCTTLGTTPFGGSSVTESPTQLKWYQFWHSPSHPIHEPFPLYLLLHTPQKQPANWKKIINLESQISESCGRMDG